MTDDLAKLNNDLKQIRVKFQTRNHLQSMIEQTDRDIAIEREKCEPEFDSYIKEKIDFENLDGYSLEAIFYTILGVQKDRLNTQRQQYLAAKLKYDEARRALDFLLNQQTSFRQQLATFADVDSVYEQLLARKTELLKGMTSPYSSRILELSEHIGHLQAMQQQQQEALFAGRAALEALSEVKHFLSAATSWGTVDMLGGGKLITYFKLSAVDEAKKASKEAQNLLLRFHAELADIGQSVTTATDFGNLIQFADFLIDGLIADWIVQSKIWKASSACSDAITKVEEVINQVEAVKDDLDRKIQYVVASHRELIELA